MLEGKGGVKGVKKEAKEEGDRKNKGIGWGRGTKMGRKEKKNHISNLFFSFIYIFFNYPLNHSYLSCISCITSHFILFIIFNR